MVLVLGNFNANVGRESYYRKGYTQVYIDGYCYIG